MSAVGNATSELNMPIDAGDALCGRGASSETRQQPSNQQRLMKVATQVFGELPRAQLYGSSSTLFNLNCNKDIDVELEINTILSEKKR